MSKIIQFLRSKDTDNQGRTLTEILLWSDTKLEQSHDTIQWLFPLPEASQFNPDAPVLTKKDIETIRRDPVIKGNLEKAFWRFVQFYNNSQWLTPHNHNYLRITRILKCLKLAEMEREMKSLKWALDMTYGNFEKVIGEETKKYWDNACL